MRAELKRIGAPPDLVQVLGPPVDKAMTQALMEASDLVVVTGSRNNVHRAYSSGTPAIGVGPGNVPVIIDSSADLKDAAEKICASKIFDNATSCSSENSVIILDDVYDDALGGRCHVNHRVTSLWAPTPEIMQRSSLAATVSSRRRGIGGVFGGRPDGVGR